MIPLPDYLAELVPDGGGTASSYGGPTIERSRPYRGIRRCRACDAPFAVPFTHGRPARYCPFCRRTSTARWRVWWRARRSFV